MKEQAIHIDLNCDLGEHDSVQEAAIDQLIMPFISSCNVACGGHASNLKVMAHTIELAFQNQVCVGAHPSYPDRTHFGRRPMNMSRSELRHSVTEQITSLRNMVSQKGHALHHVKPHGALYNQAAEDSQLASLLAETVAAIDQQLKFYGLANSAMHAACEQAGLEFVAEGFIDRAYTADGLLVPRTAPDAVITDVPLMLDRTLNWLKTGVLKAIDGQLLSIQPETLCLHGDHQQAIDVARELNQALQAHDIGIKAA